MGARIENYCRGKSWLLPVPLIAFLGYVFHEHLADPIYFGFFGYFNLVVHEAGHVLFALFGHTLFVLGGTVAQLAIPIICLIAFWMQDELLGVAFSLGWIGDNLFNVATYIADSRVRALPLITGDPDSHDWHELLSMWGMLRYDTLLGGWVRMLAVVCSLVGMFFALVLLLEMRRLKRMASEN